MTDRKFSHYFRQSPTTTIDVYRILLLFEVTDPALQHALKKVIAAGKRGAKDAAKDVREAIASLERWEEMRREEEGASERRRADELLRVSRAEDARASLLKELEMPIHTTESFAAVVARAIAELGVTDAEIAKQFDMSRPSARRWRNGQARPHRKIWAHVVAYFKARAREAQ